MRCTIACLTVLLVGCSQEPETAGYRSGATEAEFNADMGQCRAQAFGVPGAMNNLLQVAMVQRSCMEGKGWYLKPRAQ